jgi:adenylate kinase family enzyme
MLDAGDHEQLVKDKVALKMLRITNTGRDGFILIDFPRHRGEAELLEEYRGGMNSFVHLSLPDDIMVAIEENKLECTHCNRQYYTETVVSEEQGIHIDPFTPEDGHCFDCGSKDFRRSGDSATFESILQGYKAQKEELLGFYDHLGLLVDFELKTGYADYAKLKDQIQFNIKH